MDVLTALSRPTETEKSLFVTLPFEMRQAILKHCPNSTLAALARVHPLWTDSAEELLYEAVDLGNLYGEKTLCLRTLSSDARKAGLVRFLTVFLDYPNPRLPAKERIHIEPMLLVAALKNMHRLRDLRITSHAVDKRVAAELSKVISASHFHLRTLYCGLYRDLVGIIENQPSLNTIAIYLDNQLQGEHLLLKLFAKLEDKSIHIPFFFALSRENHLNSFQYTIFPELFLASHSEELIHSLLRSIAMYSWIQPDHILGPQYDAGFTIYLSDFFNMPAILRLLENISQTFTFVFALEFCVHNNIELPLGDLEGQLSHFPHLQDLTFRCRPTKPGSTSITNKELTVKDGLNYVKNTRLWTTLPALFFICIGGEFFFRD